MPAASFESAEFMAKTETADPIDVIDQFLMSDRAPEHSMGLSDLDGFLTRIVVGPELIMPSEWLPVIWGNESPGFKNYREAQTVMSAVMERYTGKRTLSLHPVRSPRSIYCFLLVRRNVALKTHGAGQRRPQCTSLQCYDLV